MAKKKSTKKMWQITITADDPLSEIKGPMPSVYHFFGSEDDAKRKAKYLKSKLTNVTRATLKNVRSS